MSKSYSVRELVSSTRKGITPKYVEFSGIIVLNQRCIRDNKIDYTNARFHDPSKKFSKDKIVQVGDILINSTGVGTAGRCAFVRELPDSKTVITDSHILIVRVKDYYTAGCLEYSLFSIQDRLQTFMDGSTGQGEFDKQILFNVVTSLPEYDKRKTAYDLLDSFDKKIELNNQINAELEVMAKTLYDYWFVQFDFPDADGKPYKSSGGKLVYNKVLKREIPEEWSDESILTVSNILGGGTPTKTKPEYWNGSIPFFTPSDSSKDIYCLKTADYITEEGLKGSSTRLFAKNTVLITARGSVGRLALNIVPMAMNQSCYALKAKKNISFSFLFYLTKELIKHLEIKASGSVFNSIVSNDIELTRFALPNDRSVIEIFAEKAEPIFEKIEILVKENQQLEELRDWLLPMLMNGQATVSQ